MKAKKTAAQDPGQPTYIEKVLDPQTQQVLTEMCMEIRTNGFVPHGDLRAKFGDRAHTVFGAICYREYRIVREVRRPWQTEGGQETPTLGYEWASRRFSQAELKKLPPQLSWMGFVTQEQARRYTDYQQALIGCVWTNYSLGALPRPDNDKLRVFDRVDGDVIIPAYCVRAMVRKTLVITQLPQAFVDRVHFAPVRVSIAEIQRVYLQRVNNGNGTHKEIPDTGLHFMSVVPAIEMSSSEESLDKEHEGKSKPKSTLPDSGLPSKYQPVVDEKIHQGKGVSEHEVIHPGTQFLIDLWYPASAIELEDLVKLFAHAGKYVRLSHARSSGFGDFKIVSVNGELLNSPASQ